MLQAQFSRCHLHFEWFDTIVALFPLPSYLLVIKDRPQFYEGYIADTSREDYDDVSIPPQVRYFLCADVATAILMRPDLEGVTYQDCEFDKTSDSVEREGCAHIVPLAIQWQTSVVMKQARVSSVLSMNRQNIKISSNLYKYKKMLQTQSIMEPEVDKKYRQNSPDSIRKVNGGKLNVALKLLQAIVVSREVFAPLSSSQPVMYVCVACTGISTVTPHLIQKM